MKKIKVSVGKFIRYCSGVKHHAWYESNVGPIRKPIQPGMMIPPRAEIKKVLDDSIFGRTGNIKFRRYTSFVGKHIVEDKKVIYEKENGKKETKKK